MLKLHFFNNMLYIDITCHEIEQKIIKIIPDCKISDLFEERKKLMEKLKEKWKKKWAFLFLAIYFLNPTKLIEK